MFKTTLGSQQLPFLSYTLNEMKTRFINLHTRTALGLQLVPSLVIIDYFRFLVSLRGGSRDSFDGEGAQLWGNIFNNRWVLEF
jgi:hypothetical protein